MKAIMTVVRDIGRDPEIFINYIRDQEKLLDKLGVGSPFDMKALEETGRSSVTRIDEDGDFKGRKIHTMVEICGEG